MCCCMFYKKFYVYFGEPWGTTGGKWGTTGPVPSSQLQILADAAAARKAMLVVGK